MTPCRNRFAATPSGQVWRMRSPGPAAIASSLRSTPTPSARRRPTPTREAVAMLSAAIEAALAPSGLGRGGYLIQYNDRNVLTGLLEAIGVDEERDGEKKLGVLRAMDKLDRLGPDGVRLLLGEGRKDESGDYTEGAKLGDADIDRVMAFMAATKDTNAATCDALAGPDRRIGSGHERRRDAGGDVGAACNAGARRDSRRHRPLGHSRS